jgi:hypothetical protein
MTTDYPDNDHNGIPDAFEHRAPLSEVLGFEVAAEPLSRRRLTSPIIAADHLESPPSIFTIEIESTMRLPLKGEYFIGPDGIERANFDFPAGSTFKAFIVRRMSK